jgi:c-di-GMP-binding flagellar brake protein YcgR
MFTALSRTLDQQRAFEVVDFLIVFSLLLAALMLALFILFLVRSRRLQREIRESAAEVYYFLLPTLALDAKDHQLIKRMSAFLPFDRPKHRILLNPDIFDACARRLLAEDQSQQAPLANLRKKLGFADGRENILPASTRDILVDMPVVVDQEEGSPVRGKVVSNDESTVSIQIDARMERVPSEGAATVYFQSRAGFFSFSTRVAAQDARLVQVVHSDQIKRYQRRRYSRKRLRLPVFVWPYQSTETIRGARSVSTPFKSILTDLSGGGASLINPEGAFQPDQQIELSFAPHGEEFHVVGQVVRVSRDGQVIHVEFQALEESDRERIVRSATKR